MYLTQTEYYFAFINLEYKEVLAILTLGLVISALSSHISSFGVYPSPFYGNGFRSLTEVRQRHDPRYLNVLRNYGTLETFKINLEFPLTQENSELLESISRTQEVQRGSLLGAYLNEEITSMEDTVERLSRELGILRDLNRPQELIQLHIEKIEQIQNIIAEYTAAERALRRQGIWPQNDR